MEFPKASIQERNDFRVNENERKLYVFLKDYFDKAYTTVISTVRYYVFGKTTTHSTDKFQVADSLQVSAHSTTAYLSLLRTEGSATAYSATAADIIGTINGVGYNGTNFPTGASIQFATTEAWNGAANGTRIDFKTTPTGSTAIASAGYIADTGSWASGAGVLNTTATTGFLYIPTCAGVPTGVPETITGRIPLVADTTGNKIYAYLGGWIALN